MADEDCDVPQEPGAEYAVNAAIWRTRARRERMVNLHCIPICTTVNLRRTSVYTYTYTVSETYQQEGVGVQVS